MDHAINILAGIGAWFVGAEVARGVGWLIDQRRQNALAKKLAALRFDEISPIDQMWARKNWPLNTDRAERLANRRDHYRSGT